LDIEPKLNDLGIALPRPPTAIGNFVAGVVFENIFYVSGTYGTVKDENGVDYIPTPERLGENFSIEEGGKSARLMLLNHSAAKGRTVQLSITSPGLDSPLHSSAEQLTAAGVWDGDQIEWDKGPIERVAGELPMYFIHFWVELPRGPIQMKYVLGFRWDGGSNRAIVCIPDPNNPWYNVHVSSIIYGNAGDCFLASEE